MIGRATRLSGRGAGEGSGAPDIRAFPRRRSLADPIGHRSCAKRGVRAAGRALFGLIAPSADSRLICQDTNGESRVKEHRDV